MLLAERARVAVHVHEGVLEDLGRVEIGEVAPEEAADPLFDARPGEGVQRLEDRWTACVAIERHQGRADPVLVGVPALRTARLHGYPPPFELVEQAWGARLEARKRPRDRAGEQHMPALTWAVPPGRGWERIS